MSIPRTAQSHRCEQAYHDWTTTPPSQRPLARGAAAAAADLDDILHGSWCDGDERASNGCIARALGVDEKQVRQYRDGRKRLPVAALYEMPRWLVERMLDRLARRLRGAGPVAAAAGLHENLDALERAPSLDSDAQASLLKAQLRIATLLARGTR